MHAYCQFTVLLLQEAVASTEIKLFPTTDFIIFKIIY